MSVVDTTFLIDLERGWPAAQRMLGDVESFGGPMFVPAVVWMEYLSGVRPAQRPAKVRVLDHGGGFVPFDRSIADEAVRLATECATLGRPLSWTDLQVAATARVLHEELVSNDGVFANVPGLVVQPY